MSPDQDISITPLEKKKGKKKSIFAFVMTISVMIVIMFIMSTILPNINTTNVQAAFSSPTWSDTHLYGAYYYDNSVDRNVKLIYTDNVTGMQSQKITTGSVINFVVFNIHVNVNRMYNDGDTNYTEHILASIGYKHSSETYYTTAITTDPNTMIIDYGPIFPLSTIRNIMVTFDLLNWNFNSTGLYMMYGSFSIQTA